MVKKKKMLSNLIEFVVGSILLVFCISYLQNHPAEKVSLVSGMKLLVQKVSLRVHNFSGEDTELLQEKFQLEKTFQEILFLAEQSRCSESITVSIKTSYEKLQKMDIETYKAQQKAYSTVANLYYTKVRQECGTE